MVRWRRWWWLPRQRPAASCTTRSNMSASRSGKTPREMHDGLDHKFHDTFRGIEIYQPVQSSSHTCVVRLSIFRVHYYVHQDLEIAYLPLSTSQHFYFYTHPNITLWLHKILFLISSLQNKKKQKLPINRSSSLCVCLLLVRLVWASKCTLVSVARWANANANGAKTCTGKMRTRMFRSLRRASNGETNQKHISRFNLA